MGNDDQNNSAGATSGVVTTINKTVFHIPPFNEDDIELWFNIVDQACSAAGVCTEKSKLGTVVGYLSKRCSHQVRDIIMNPTTSNPYTALKTALISRLGVSIEKKTRQLLEREAIGDRKPTQFLRNLRGLGGTTFPEAAYRTLFMNRLPATAQAILAAHTKISLNDLAEIADNIVETLKPVPVVDEVATYSLESLIELKFAQLNFKMQYELAAIQRNFDDKLANAWTHNHRRAASPWRRNRSRSRGRNNNVGWCRYLQRFGAAAKKCTRPCTFIKNEQEGR